MIELFSQLYRWRFASDARCWTRLTESSAAPSRSQYLSCECSALRDALLACIRHRLGTSLQQMRSAAWREIRSMRDGR